LWVCVCIGVCVHVCVCVSVYVCAHRDGRPGGLGGREMFGPLDGPPPPRRGGPGVSSLGRWRPAGLEHPAPASATQSPGPRPRPRPCPRRYTQELAGRVAQHALAPQPPRPDMPWAAGAGAAPRIIDAPVSGGVLAASNATLTFMARPRPPPSPLRVLCGVERDVGAWEERGRRARRARPAGARPLAPASLGEATARPHVAAPSLSTRRPRAGPQVGGPLDAVAAARPLLSSMGTRIVHLGGAGLGHAAKICNNACLGPWPVVTRRRPPSRRAADRRRAAGVTPRRWRPLGRRAPAAAALRPAAPGGPPRPRVYLRTPAPPPRSPLPPTLPPPRREQPSRWRA
jgi:hypothetical protein